LDHINATADSLTDRQHVPQVLGVDSRGRPELAVRSWVGGGQPTGGIERFSTMENFRKILKVSHFYLEFSWNENHNKIKYSHQVSSKFSGPYRVPLEFQGLCPKKPNETLRECLISLLFLSGENHK